jgi:hypothetical protein
MLARSIGSGVLLAAGAVAVFALRRDAGDDAARTAALAAVLAGGLAMAWVERRPDLSWWRAGLPRTLRFWIVSVAVAASLPLVLTVPTLARLLHVAPIGVVDLLLAVGIAVTSIAWRFQASGTSRPTSSRVAEVKHASAFAAHRREAAVPQPAERA